MTKKETVISIRITPMCKKMKFVMWLSKVKTVVKIRQ